jgi:hypothetical protein
MVAVHEGRWDPTSLISTTAGALTTIPDLADVAARLRDPAVDDLHKLDLVRRVLATQRLLLVFDDFEQNLSRPGGDTFLDPTVEDAITALCDSAEVGAVLVTSRYPLPGPQDLLIEIPIPPLSPSELARLFLRLPALRDLDPEDRRLLHRTVGGHPRLIEFVDALLRGGRANLKQVQAKLRDLARSQGIDLTRPRRLARPWIRRCCWAVPTSCWMSCSTCSLRNSGRCSTTSRYAELRCVWTISPTPWPTIHRRRRPPTHETSTPMSTGSPI